MFDGQSRAGLHLDQWLDRFGEPTESQQPSAMGGSVVMHDTEEGGAGPLEDAPELSGDLVAFDLEPHKTDVLTRAAEAQAKYTRRYALRQAEGRPYTSDVLPLPEAPIVDLDPSIHAKSPLLRWYINGRDDGSYQTWNQIRPAPGSQGCIVTADWMPGSNCVTWPLRVRSYSDRGYSQIARLTAAFDTSLIEGAVASCRLTLKKASGDKVDIAIRSGIVLNDTGNATFGNALSTGTDLGKADYIAATGVFTSGNLVGYGFSKNPNFAISVLDYDHDYLDEEPADADVPAHPMVFDVTPENGPYLEYTIGSPATPHRGLMGVGR
jgi:hypothetical protein